jgi:hypothetical protein
MADMVRNENVTTLRRGYLPRPAHSTGTEKNSADYVATEKAEGPVARSHGVNLKNDQVPNLQLLTEAASHLAVQQNHLRTHARYWGNTMITGLQQAPPIFEPTAAGNQKYSPVAVPERQEPLFVQIKITTNT